MYRNRFDVPVSALFTIDELISEDQQPPTWNWSQELDALWHHTQIYYNAIRTQTTDAAADVPRHAQLLATFFFHRKVQFRLDADCLRAGQRLDALRSVMDHVDITAPKDEFVVESHSDLMTLQEKNTAQLLTPLVEQKEQVLVQPPSLQTVIPSSQLSFQLASTTNTANHAVDITPPIFYTVERAPIPIPDFEHTPDPQPAQPGGPMEVSFHTRASIGPLCARVEAMDVVEDLKGK